ncbi:MAG: tetratricopeptide repeat protein [Crocinitomicaceae bacterium]
MKLFLLFPLILAAYSLSLAQPKYAAESRKVFKQAVKEYENNNQSEAEKLFRQCVELEPNYAEAYFNLSKISYKNEQFPEALVNAQKAYSKNKLQPTIYSQLGRCHFQLESYDSAAYYLHKAIRLGDKSENTYLFAAKSFNEIKDYAEAIQNVNKAIEINDKSPLNFNTRGQIFFNRGDYENAVIDFEKALEINPNSTGIYVNLANTKLLLGEEDEAIKLINTGLSTASKEEKVQLYLLQGNYYHKKGDYKKATENYEKAKGLDQNNAAVLNNQAAVFLDQGKFQSALELCNEALDLNPEMTAAYFNRGIANEMLKNVDAACSDWEQAFILGSEKAEEYLNSPTCNE